MAVVPSGDNETAEPNAPSGVAVSLNVALGANCPDQSPSLPDSYTEADPAVELGTLLFGTPTNAVAPSDEKATAVVSAALDWGDVSTAVGDDISVHAASLEARYTYAVSLVDVMSRSTPTIAVVPSLERAIE
jgi:hypothetical protein